MTVTEQWRWQSPKSTNKQTPPLRSLYHTQAHPSQKNDTIGDDSGRTKKVKMFFTSTTTTVDLSDYCTHHCHRPRSFAPTLCHFMLENLFQKRIGRAFLHLFASL
jgi:hypothetical protein